MTKISAPPVPVLSIAPEAILAAGALVILLVRAVFGRGTSRSSDPAGREIAGVVSSCIALVSLAISTAATVALWREVVVSGGEVAIGRMLVIDPYAVFFKFLFSGIGAMAVILGGVGLREEGYLRDEYPALVLLATVGMMLMAASNDLIMIFLALELFSLAFYVIAAFARDKLGPQEAALKYFLLGAFASGFLLYGAALIYGATASTNLGDIATFLARTEPSWLLLGGVVLLLVGFGFKVAAVPFHMWAPDVYQGAPSPVVGFLAAGAKAAGVAALIRVFVSAFAEVRIDWVPVVSGLAVVTMLAAACLAIVQRDVKRMLAYSSIVHAGYLLIGVVVGSREAIAASLFYLCAYAAMVFGAFAVVALVSGRDDRATSIDDFAGLARRSPAAAAVFSVFLLGLAGIPPTSGFVAKFALFQAAVSAGYTWLALVGVVASVIAAFFYIRLMLVMFTGGIEAGHEVGSAAEAAAAAPLRPGPVAVAGVGVALALTLALGVAPGLLLELARQAELFSPAL